MSMKKYVVTKDIYHKGKLLKAGTVVASETNHKYFEPYEKDEFSNEKEPATIVIKDQPDSNVKYNADGVVIKPGEKKPAAQPKANEPKQSAPVAKGNAAPKGKTSAAAAAAADDEDADNEGDKAGSEDAF